MKTPKDIADELFWIVCEWHDEDGYQNRYESWDKAVKGHARAVKIAKKAEK